MEVEYTITKTLQTLNFLGVKSSDFSAIIVLHSFTCATVLMYVHTVHVLGDNYTHYYAGTMYTSLHLE